ncbi:MAG: hypothetical protein WC841_01150 [Candidatus Shapirobacteria bacterium]|jgi:hypothetical protein
MKLTYLKSICLLLCATFIFSACGKKDSTKDVIFSDAENEIETISPYVDKLASVQIDLSKTIPLNQEFEVIYKTANPDGIGKATFKAKSMKEIPKAGLNTPEEGKKLVLVEISIRGNKDNKGEPSGFNQIGDKPSPQFVMINKDKNISEVETTYFSDSYTVEKKLFELSKITLDHDQWVHTALVFQLDKDSTPDLAFRFTNPEGKTAFYDLQ